MQARPWRRVRGGLASVRVRPFVDALRAALAAQDAISSPLLDNISVEGAQGVLINVIIGRWSASGHFFRSMKREVGVATTCLYRVTQLFCQVDHVVVLVAVALGFAQADTVDDACMVERVADDSVFRSKNRLE